MGVTEPNKEETKWHTFLISLLLGYYILIVHPIHMSRYVFSGHIHPLWIRRVNLLKTDGDQVYQVHNGTLASPGQQSQCDWSGLQSRPLSRNNISNSKISTECQYTPQELLWPQTVLSSVATSSHYEAVYIDALVFPIPSVCWVSYYNQFIVQLSVYVHDIRFTRINQEYSIRSTLVMRCEILEVAPEDSTGGPHH